MTTSYSLMVVGRHADALDEEHLRAACALVVNGPYRRLWMAVPSPSALSAALSSLSLLTSGTTIPDVAFASVEAVNLRGALDAAADLSDGCGNEVSLVLASQCPPGDAAVAADVVASIGGPRRSRVRVGLDRTSAAASASASSWQADFAFVEHASPAELAVDRAHDPGEGASLLVTAVVGAAVGTLSHFRPLPDAALWPTWADFTARSGAAAQLQRWRSEARFLFGTPSSVVNQLGAFVAAGTDEVVLDFSIEAAALGVEASLVGARLVAEELTALGLPGGS